MEFSRPWRACRRGPRPLRDATLAGGLAPWGYGPSLPRGPRPRGLLAPWGSAATIVSRPHLLAATGRGPGHHGYRRRTRRQPGWAVRCSRKRSSLVKRGEGEGGDRLTARASAARGASAASGACRLKAQVGRRSNYGTTVIQAPAFGVTNSPVV